MAEAILMPRLSDTMTEGIIATWHHEVGDTIKKGDLLADVETDKATMELESYQNGTILYLGKPVGGKILVNDLLLILGQKGEDFSKVLAKHNASTNAPQTESSSPTAQAETQIATANLPTVAAVETSKSSINPHEMEEVIFMPRLSDTMTEGLIASWHVKVGDMVAKGDILADVETDKATMELESYKTGKLLYLGAGVGDKIQVNDLLCIIGKDGFDVDAVLAALKNGTANAVTAIAKATEANANEALPVEEAIKQTVVEPTIVNSGRIFASPLAKKIASEKGIDLKYVQGSGDGGRIVKNDVDSYVPSKPAAIVEEKALTTTASTTHTSLTTATVGTVSFEEVPVSQMRKVIAKRLSESLFTAPHFFLTMSINMDACIAARTTINETAKSKISFNDIVLKAVAIALKQHPKVNSSWLGDKIRINHHVNIGVAVAVEDGLLVPVVRFADAKSLSQINVEVKDFAQKAKDKKLQPADWEGSTFTISNLGMFGIDQFTAIINPPDACILAVGGISQEPIVKDGAIVVGNIMKLTLSCDHRVVDGATGSAFLQTLKNLLEQPVRMLV